MTRHQRITRLVQTTFTPDFLLIEDESDQHRRAGNETHFKVIIVSHHFNNQARIERHRTVNALLEEELSTGLHALSLHLYTPMEWEVRTSIPMTPSCAKSTQIQK